MVGGREIPLEVLLSWPKPNYIDPITKPKYVLVFSCILGPISIAMLLARLWVRLRIQRSVGWDDWLMLASWFPMIGLTIIFPLVTEKYHFNVHIWDLDMKWHPIQRHFVMAIYALFTLSSGLIKMSILFFYRRLSARSVSSAFRWTLRITIAIIGVHTVIFVFITIFMCSPVSAFWDSQNLDMLSKGYTYKCANEGAEIVANGIISTVQDFVAASLPALLCWKLQMRLRQKIALYSVFAVSYLAVVLGALRTYSCYHLFFQTYDVTWAACDVWLWSLLEIHVGAICANAPAVKSCYAHYFKSTPTHSYGTSGVRSQPRPSPTATNHSTTSTLWAKIPFWKRSNRHSSSGYLSGSQTHISTNHGNIVQMDGYNGNVYEQKQVETTIRTGGRNSLDEAGELEMGMIQAKRVVSIQQSEVTGLPSDRPVKGWKPY
ncbi:hypothetical protein BKA63DRAFT_18643 [Paraphoma chrysanthemicola]|nr:hypothetical protein BKA63DRAFT_18643 [Paraphoma chrysanthemicola]